MMHVVSRNTITVVVVPYGKHTAKDGGVTFFKLHSADVCGCPVVVEVVAIEVVVIITSSRHDINKSIGDRNEFVTLFLHILRLSEGVVPNVHDDIFALHGSFALRVCQRAPKHGLLAVAFNELDVVVSKFTELFYHLLIAVAIFVSTDVYLLTAEHGIFTFKIFAEDAIDEGIGFGVEHVEVIHAVILTTEFGFVVYECQAVSGHVNFGDNFNIVVFTQNLKVDEFLLCVVTVLSGKSRVLSALKAESRRSLIPIVTEELAETIVVEVHLKGIHLVISHYLHQVVEVINGHKLTGYVNHETAQFINGHVNGFTLGERLILFRKLEQCTCCPESSLSCSGGYSNMLTDIKAVTFLT